MSRFGEKIALLIVKRNARGEGAMHFLGRKRVAVITAMGLAAPGLSTRNHFGERFATAKRPLAASNA